MRIGRKERRFIVAQMGKPVSGQLVTAHCLDKPRHFPRPTRHDGDKNDYQNMNVDGEWMEFEKLKYIYSNHPGKLSPLSVMDITRLATIILSEKLVVENGFRKSKIKMYNPPFNLIDVRKSTLDFQDDKWIEISIFNSDTPLYRLKRWWRGIMNGSKRKGEWR